MDYQFWIPLLILGGAMAICERKWCLLRDLTQPKPQPYSWSRVQLAWWTVIVLSGFIAIIWKGHIVNGVLQHDAVDLPQSAVILLGISSLTSITARTMDAASPELHVVHGTRENFFLDILSDYNGISIARFQTVAFNFIFGIWYVSEVNSRLGTDDINSVMPVITPNNLILLGLSSAAYTAMKITENKEKANALAVQATENTPADDTTDLIEPAVG